MPKGISLRLFFIMLTILLLFAWQMVRHFSSVLETGFRQTAETTLVDIAQILAANLSLEYQKSGMLNAIALREQMQIAHTAPLNASIYNHTKTALELNVLLTDANGMVLFNSTGREVGVNYANWHDIKATLNGQYGARMSWIDPNQPQLGKAMHVAAAVRSPEGQIVGVLSVSQSVSALTPFNTAAVHDIRIFIGAYLFLILFLLAVLAWWLARALNNITIYAENLAAGRTTKKPKFSDVYLRRLAEAVGRLRSDLDAGKAVEHTVYGLTHALKTPLTTVRAAVELLDEPDLTHQEAQELSGQIRHAGVRMQNLIDRLLALSRLENRQTVSREIIDLATLAQEFHHDYRLALASKRLRLVFQAFQGTMTANRELFCQALINVIDNAIAFATADTSITVAYDVRASSISVENIGTPIPEYALAKLTERFFSLPRPDGQPKSSGLGLSIVAHIMKLHEGQLAVSNTGNGVRVVLRF